jgi:hypothetical protein
MKIRDDLASKYWLLAAEEEVASSLETEGYSVKRETLFGVELTRFCGHLSIGDVSPPEGSPHGTNEATLYAGVPH